MEESLERPRRIRLRRSQYPAEPRAYHLFVDSRRLRSSCYETADSGASLTLCSRAITY